MTVAGRLATCDLTDLVRADGGGGVATKLLMACYVRASGMKVGIA